MGVADFAAAIVIDHKPRAAPPAQASRPTAENPVKRHSPKPSPTDNAIEAAAAAWLAQADDHLSRAQSAAFARWRKANVRHEAAVERLEKTWAALRALRDYPAARRGRPDAEALSPRRRVRGMVIPFTPSP